MRSYVKKILCLTATMLLCVGIFSIHVLASEADSYTASSMRLLHYEGEVELLDKDGNAAFFMENFRLNSGQTLTTAEESNASVELDEERIVTLDEETSVEFTQKGDSLVMDLQEGTILLDVENKLDQNEALDIETSNMTVGIRGTAVYVINIPAGDERLKDQSGSSQAKILPLLGQEGSEIQTNADGSVTIFGVIQGNADITWTDSNGEQKTINITEGTKAILLGAPGEDTYAGPVVAPVEEDDVSLFLENNLSEKRSSSLQQILSGCESSENDPYDPEGNWLYCGTVTLIAQSASKMYDGTPLTEQDILVDGLPEGFSIKAETGGSQLDAGTSDNPIISHKIYNYRNEDVTAHFTTVEYVSGQLVVDPVPVTVRTGSAERVYNGSALTSSEAEITTAVSSQEIKMGQNISYINTQPFGEIPESGEAEKGYDEISADMNKEVLYGIVGETTVHGTNPLTEETKEIVLKAGQRLTVSINESEDGDSIEYLVEDLEEKDIPPELLRIYADNEDILKQAVKETGWDIDKILELISLLPETDEKMVEENGVLVREEEAGTTLQNYTNVWIDVDSDITEYAGRSLAAEEARFMPITVESSIKVTATGSQTQTGQSKNTYTIDWGTANKDNYAVTEELGNLKVTPAQLIVTTGSAEKPYDGTPLTSAEASISGLVAGEIATVTTTGSRTEVGTSNNTYTINWISASRGNYTVAEKLGTLTVTSRSESVITVTTGSASKTYDGAPLTSSEVTISGLPEGVSPVVTTTGTITDAGTAVNTYTIDWNGFDPSNCLIIENLGTLTVEKALVTVTTSSAQKSYDGTALTSAEASLTGLIAGETATATGTGSRINAGTSVNTYTINWGSANKNNYNVTENLGTLTVTKASLEIHTASDEKAYDGTPLVRNDAEIVGLAKGERITVKTNGSQKDVGSYQNIFTIEWENADQDNYTVEEYPGTLTVTPATVTITTGSAEKVYDGTALTNAEATITGLAAGESVTVTADGALTNAGKTDNTYIISWDDADKKNYTVTESLGTLTVTPAKVTVTTSTETKAYDGTPLTGSVSVTGLVTGEEPVITESGTITDAGTAVNTYTIDWGTVTPENYVVTDSLGTLTITPLQAVFDLNCYTVTFNGYKFVPDGITGTYANGSEIQCLDLEFSTGGYDYPEAVVGTFQLLGDDIAKLTCSGVRDAGNNTITPAVQFTAGNAGNYEFSYTNNVMTIVPLDVEFDLGGTWTEYVPIVYDGEFHGGDLSVSSDVEGYEVEQITETQWQVTWDFGDVINVQVTGGGTDAGSHTLNCAYTFSSGNAGNYTINTTGKTLYISPAQLTVITASADKYYDGTPLTKNEFSIEGLVNDETITVTVTGTITEIGTTPNTCTVTWGTAKESNYEISYSLGTLEVKKPTVTITIGSISKEYDGTPLTTCGEIIAEGLPDGYAMAYLSDFITGSQTDVGSSQITYDPNGYGITDSSGMSATELFNIVVDAGYRTVTPLEVTFEIQGYTDTYEEYSRYLPEDISGFYDSTGEEIEGDLGGLTVERTATFTLKGGATAVVTVIGLNPDGPGTYYFDPSCEFTEGSSTNYNIKYANTALILN